jgi:hypothetical protein
MLGCLGKFRLRRLPVGYVGALMRNIMAQSLREPFSVVSENLCIVSAS